MILKVKLDRLVVVLMALLISIDLIGQEIPVDPLTGRPQVVIPIWKISNGSLTVPISIAYNGGGVKVQESEGNAGMSWNLQAAGYVVRELRGLPDDYKTPGDTRKGWLYGSGQEVNSFVPTSDDNCTDWNNLYPLTNKNFDTEPDVFHFSAPGLQGQFIFDNSGTLRLVPFQDVKVAYTTVTNSGISTITITTNRGVRYFFTLSENLTREAVSYQGSASQFSRDFDYYSQSLTYTSRWLLTSMTGPLGESITFQYSEPFYGQSKQYVRKANPIVPHLDSVYFFDHLSEVRQLSSINAYGYTATFNWAGTKDLLSSIQIQGGAQFKNFILSYETIRNPAEPLGYNKEGNRNYLKSIMEENSCQALPAFKFEYYSPTSIPYMKDYPADIFGYFNNATPVPITGLFPPVYRNDTAPVGETFRFYNKAGYTAVNNTVLRDVNPATVYYGSLKKITYPSGGFAELTYQPNDYYDESTATTLLGGGVRVSSVKISDGDADASNDIIRNYEYKQTNGQSSGRWLYGPAFAFFDGTSVVMSPDNLAPNDYIMYERASEIIPANGKTIYEYLLPGRYPQTGISDWSATKTRIVKPTASPCSSSGNLRVDYYTYPFAPNVNYNFEQGLISKLQIVNESGQLIQEKNYTYQRLATPVTIKALRYEKTFALYSSVVTGYVYGLYSILANVDKTTQTETVTGKDLNYSTVAGTATTTYTFNSNQMLSEISRSNSDGTVFKDQFKYVKDFAVTNPSGLQATMLKKLNATNQHGLVVERLRLANSTVIEAGLTIFDSLSTAKLYYPANHYSYKGTGAFTAATLTGTPQVFTYENTKYVKEVSVEQVNQYGLPSVSIGRDRKPLSILYSYDRAAPALQMVGARPNQIIFSDFENSEAYQLASANVTNDFWTGEKCYQLTNTVTLSRTGLVKSSDKFYRFLVRAKATTATNITISIKFSNGIGGWITNSVVYPSAASGSWKLLESRIDMSTVPENFDVQITTGQTILLDDILLYPEQAELSYYSYKYLTGKTSESNLKGQSSFYEYDILGRLTTLRDQDKQVVESHDYRYQAPTVPAPLSGFTSSVSQIVSGQTVTFTSFANCLTPLTYEWRVNGVVQTSTLPTMTYTFPNNRDYDVQLTVSHPQYGSTSTTTHYDVPPAPLLASLSVDITTPIDLCWQDYLRTFTVSAISGCYDPADVTYEWYFTNTSINFQNVKVATTTTPQLAFNFMTLDIPRNYVMKCVIRSTCGSGAYKEVSTGTTNQLGINYTPCN
jgi:hypothetical protein